MREASRGPTPRAHTTQANESPGGVRGGSGMQGGAKGGGRKKNLIPGGIFFFGGDPP